MKNILRIFVLTIFAFPVAQRSYAQCTFGGTQYPTGTYSNPGASFVQVSTCIFGGEYQLYSVVSGTTYEWSYCTGDGTATAAGEDLQLTLFNNATGASLAYSDDFCGLAPKINWTATFTGTVRVLTSLYFCTTNTTCHTLTWRSISGGGGGTGCNNLTSYGSSTIPTNNTTINTVSCAYAGEYSTWTGAVAGQTLRFTSTIATDYITVRSGTPGGPILAQGTQPVQFNNTFTGTIYVHVNTNSACGTQNTCRDISGQCLSCTAPAVNPCNTIGTIAACGTNVSANLSGTGVWDVTACGFSTPGQESIFQFTPTTTGVFNLNVTSITGGYIDFFWKAASGGCSSTGWNCIDDIISTGTYAGVTPMSFTAGTTYYILLDPELTGAYTATFNIGCPAPPQPAPGNDNCVNAVPVTLPCSGPSALISGTTLGATEEAIADPSCDPGDIKDVWYSFNTGNVTSVDLTVTLGTASWLGGEVFTTCGTLATGLTIGGNAGNCDFNLLTPSPTTISGLLPNTTYRLRLFSNITFDAAGTFSFTLAPTGGGSIQPTIATLPAITGQCSATVTAPTATSPCSGLITGTTTSPTTYNTEGTYNITWTYSDGILTSTQNQTVTIDDNTAPVPSVASLSPVNSTCAINSLTAPSATDNCAGSVIGTANVTFPITQSTSVTWTFNDGNGNTSTQSQQITVADQEAPIPSQASLSPVTSSCSPVSSLNPPTATDNCSGSVVGTTTATFPISTTTTVVWTYTDASGNTSTQNQLVVVGDNVAPVPTTQTLNTITSTCPLASLTAPTATDNCAGTVTGTTTTTFPIASTTLVTWTYSDGNGNTTTQQQNVVVSDVTAPVPSLPSLNTVTSSCSSVSSLAVPTANDNCSGVVTGTTTTIFPITQSATVVWTFTDAAGNSSTQNQSVVIGDNAPPVPNTASLAPITSTCSVPSITAPTATDNCSGSVTGTTNTTFPINTSTTVTWTYTDATGNTATQQQQVTINDNVAPVPDVASLTSVTSTCNPVASLTAPTATDNCAGAVTGTTTTVFPITQSTTVVWTFTDGIGNTATQNQSVVIGDVTAPVPNQAQLAAVSDACSVSSLTAPTATDNCAGTVTATTTTIFPITQTTTVTWTFTDPAGNATTQTQVVTISDQIAPVPDAASLSSVSGTCSVASVTPPTATDNCAGVITGTTTTVFPVTQSTTITWTFTDGSGNTTTQTQSVSVTDQTAPVPDATSLSTVNSSCSVNTIAPPTATDGCDGVITGTTTTVFPITTNTSVTWTFTDNAGNVSTQTQDVVISDTSAPTPDVANLPAIDAVCELNTLTPPTASSGCGNSVTGVSDANLPIQSTTIVTWTYTGSNGNITTQTQQVNITPISTSTTLTGSTLSVDSPVNGATYQWIDCNTGNAVAGANSETFTPTVDGSYAVEISIGSCIEQSSCTDVTVTNGLSEEVSHAFLVYPNPTMDNIWVDCQEKATMLIFDLNGKVLYTFNLHAGIQQLSINELATGSYTAEIISDHAVQTIRLIKE